MQRSYVEAKAAELRKRQGNRTMAYIWTLLLMVGLTMVVDSLRTTQMYTVQQVSVYAIPDMSDDDAFETQEILTEETPDMRVDIYALNDKPERTDTPTDDDDVDEDEDDDVPEEEEVEPESPDVIERVEDTPEEESNVEGEQAAVAVDESTEPVNPVVNESEDSATAPTAEATPDAINTEPDPTPEAAEAAPETTTATSTNEEKEVASQATTDS